MAYHSFANHSPETSLSSRKSFMVPPTTDFTVIFPFDKHTGKFDRLFYYSALTDGRASQDQIDLFLREIEQILQRKSKPINIIIWLFVFLAFSVLLGLTYHHMDRYDTEREMVIKTMIAYLFVVVLCSGTIQLYRRHTKKKAKKAIEAAIRRSYLEFEAQGLRWNIPAGFPKWIELWKYYKFEAEKIVGIDIRTEEVKAERKLSLQGISNTEGNNGQRGNNYQPPLPEL